MSGTNISETFPTIFDQSLILNEALTPIVLIAAIAALIGRGIQGMNGDIRAMTMGIATTLIVAVLIPTFPGIVNNLQLAIHEIAQSTGADPSDTASEFAKLVVGETDEEDVGLIDVIFDRNGGLGKALTYLVVLLFSYLALAIQYVIALIQQFLLIFGIALSPIFFGMILISATRSIGTTYFLNIFAIALWPIGFSLGDLVVSALVEQAAAINAQSKALPLEEIETSQTFFYAAVICLMLLITSIGGPIVITKAVTTGANAGAALLQRTSSALGLGATYGMLGANAAQLGGASPLGSVAAGAVSAASGVVTGASDSSGALLPAVIGLSAIKGTMGKDDNEPGKPTDYNAKAAEISNRQK